MKIATIVCSYNTAEMTDTVVSALLRGKKHDIYVLDNSSTEEQVYKNEAVKVIDIGRDNVGFGGMHDYIFQNFREYDFVGIFNNDIYDIPDNFFEILEKNLDKDDGMVSPSFYRNGSGWEQMWRIHKDGKRQVFHVENIACYYNTQLFKKFSDFIPYEFYGGTGDIMYSELAKKEGYKLYVIDDVEIGHMLAGAREKAGVKDEYLRNHSGSLNNWLEKRPEIKELYHNYLADISREVCVVIPNYNHNDLLPRAIESVLKNNTKCDIVVVDDFSDSDPYEQIKHFPIRYLRHDQNRGLSAVRNTAISGTKAKYILPLDADDEVFPGAIDALLKNIKESQADVSYGNLVWRDNNQQLKPTGDVTMEHFYNNNQLFGCSLYKRDCWKTVGGYWEKKEHYEDWDFWGRVCKEGYTFKYVDVDVYLYGGNQDGMCARLGKNREENATNCINHIKNYETSRLHNNI